MPRNRVAIIGSGLIGRSWAVVFARGGCEVLLYDTIEAQVDKALGWIEAALGEMSGAGLVSDPNWVRSLIRPSDSLVQAVAGCNFVQESVGEEIGLKREIHAELDRLAPISAVIASSTSALLPSQMFSDLPGRFRFVVAHPMNPPHLAPIVEICGAPFTYPETLETTRKLMTSCGQVPIVIEREIDGFILNRLQHAVLNEAFRLIAGGYVSPEDLDHTVKNGLALRWSFMGPLETIDLNAPQGIADYLARYGSTIRRIGKDMNEQPEWPDEVGKRLNTERRKAVPLAKLEDEASWRDKRLMALARHKAEAAAKFGK